MQSAMQPGHAPTEFGCGWNWPPSQPGKTAVLLHPRILSRPLPDDSSLIRRSQYPDWCLQIHFFDCHLHENAEVWTFVQCLLCWSPMKVTHATVWSQSSFHDVCIVYQLSIQSPLTHELFPGRLLLYGCYTQTSRLWWMQALISLILISEAGLLHHRLACVALGTPTKQLPSGCTSNSSSESAWVLQRLWIPANLAAADFKILIILITNVVISIYPCV